MAPDHTTLVASSEGSDVEPSKSVTCTYAGSRGFPLLSELERCG